MVAANGRNELSIDRNGSEWIHLRLWEIQVSKGFAIIANENIVFVGLRSYWQEQRWSSACFI
jgi:hypothetical protein